MILVLYVVRGTIKKASESLLGIFIIFWHIVTCTPLHISFTSFVFHLSLGVIWQWIDEQVIYGFYQCKQTTKWIPNTWPLVDIWSMCFGQTIWRVCLWIPHLFNLTSHVDDAVVMELMVKKRVDAFVLLPRIPFFVYVCVFWPWGLFVFYLYIFLNNFLPAFCLTIT